MSKTSDWEASRLIWNILTDLWLANIDCLEHSGRLAIVIFQPNFLKLSELLLSD